MRFLFRFTIAAVVAATAIAGCSGATQSGDTPGLPAAAPYARPGAQLPVRVTVAIPKRLRRRPAYLSPATQSISVRIVKGSKTIMSETVDLTPASKGCKSSLASTLCTITVFLSPGKYTASLTTYDGLNATGHALSTAQGIGFTIKNGALNTIPLTLSGIPAAILVTDAGPDAVYAFAQDADGNFIVGAGSPAFAATNASGPAVAVISGPTPSKPNLISFSAAATPVDGTETIGITASYPSGTNGCAQAGAVCSAPAAVIASYEPQLLVGTYAGNVTGFQAPLTSDAQVPDLNVPLPELGAMAVDAHGNVFAASYDTTGVLYEISPPYQSATRLNSNDLVEVNVLTVDANENVYAAGNGGNSVSAFGYPYTGAPAVVTDGVDEPVAVTADSSGNLYVANAGTRTVAAYAGPSFSGTPVSVSTASTPRSLTIAGSTLYVGELSDVETFSLPLSNGQSATAKVATGTNWYAASLAVDASGNLYVANWLGGGGGFGAIEEFTAPITPGESPAALISYSNAGAYGPHGIVLAPGYLYVCDTFGGVDTGGVDEFALPLSSASTPVVSLASSYVGIVASIAIGQPVFTVTP